MNLQSFGYGSFDPLQMILGQTLLKGATVYSPWFQSAADAVTVAYEVIGLSTNGSVTVSVEHRNTDTLESGVTTEATTITLNATGIKSARYTGLKQLVRLKLVAAGTTAMDWVHFRLLAPAWESIASPAFATSLPTLRRAAQALGVTLFKGLTVYSPWFPRRANAATFLAQTVARVGATCTITVQTKLASDVETGNITDLANTITCNAVGTTSARNADLKELVRFKYVLTGTNSTDWIHFLVLEPQWENN